MIEKGRIKEKLTSDIAILGYIAGLKLALQLVAIQGYGTFRDEFYYIACSENLDFGYVDQPPLAMFVLRFIRLLFGDSVLAIRIVPALSGFLFVFLTGLIARELGGKKYAVFFASLAALAPIGNFFSHTIYSMNCLDHLFWLACFYIIIKIIKTGNSRLWLLFGLVVGLGLLNKISVLFLGFGIVVGLCLTGERKHLKNKNIWFGFVVSLLLFLPYVLWNMAHDWAHLEFIRNAKAFKMYAVSPLEFIGGQILYNNPATLLVWLAGLWFFFFNKSGRKYHLFGWMFLSIFMIFMLQAAKDYYLSGAYPILFAAGAVQLESFFSRKKWRWLKVAAPVVVLMTTLVFAPMALPILPVNSFIKYANFLGIEGVKGEKHDLGTLPQHYADMHGWEEIVSQVAEVYRMLSPEEKAECAISAQNYGEAGAIDFLGKKYGLPKAISGHNNYYLWGPRGYSGDVMIIIGGNKERCQEVFEEVVEAGRTLCTYCMPYENDLPIFICRKIKQPLKDIWPNVKHYN